MMKKLLIFLVVILVGQREAHADFLYWNDLGPVTLDSTVDGLYVDLFDSPSNPYENPTQLSMIGEARVLGALEIYNRSTAELRDNASVARHMQAHQTSIITMRDNARVGGHGCYVHDSARINFYVIEFTHKTIQGTKPVTINSPGVYNLKDFDRNGSYGGNISGVMEGGDPFSNNYFDQTSGLDGAGVYMYVINQDPNLPPVADAGEDVPIRAGDAVTLDGSESFDDNTASPNLIYSWSFVSIPEDSTATLSNW